MKLEQQVISLELAKKLKELGVKQESLFYHYATEIEQDGLAWWTVAMEIPRKGKKVRDYLDSVGRPSICAAFTVAELGEMLPKKYVWWSYSGFVAEAWGCTITIDGKDLRTDADTEADARAKMLIHLIENKLINVPG